MAERPRRAANGFAAKAARRLRLALDRAVLRRLARLVLLALVGALGPAIGPPGAVAAQRDWRTYGFSSTRVGLNPTERSIGPARARALHRLWAVDLGGPIATQPLVAFGVRLASGGSTNLVYAGTAFGRFAAIDAASGQVERPKGGAVVAGLGAQLRLDGRQPAPDQR